MKKILFGLIATLMLSVSVYAQSKTSSEIGNTHMTPKSVGSYAASTGCAGWSFCNSSAPWTSSAQTGTTAQTLNADKTMSFKIPLSSMNADNVKFYLNKTTFELKDNSPLQQGEYVLFGLKSTTVYLAGVYPLTNDGTHIKFTVSYQ